MRLIFSIVLLLSVSTGVAALTEHKGQCLKPTAPRTTHVTDAYGKTVEKVLCCCTNSSGNQCCGYQDMCIGLVFGCFCRDSGPSEPAPSRP